MPNDVYEQVLISPILRATTIKQVRARARWARKKLALHEKATRMSVGDAAQVLDRITEAEKMAAVKIIEREGVDDAVKAAKKAAGYPAYRELPIVKE